MEAAESQVQAEQEVVKEGPEAEMTKEEPKEPEEVQSKQELEEKVAKEEPEVQTKEADGKFQDEKFRKLFIGALSFSTTSESLKQFYSQYGTIVDTVVMYDPVSRKSRGFGFVTFSSMDEVDKAMKSRPHAIDGKAVDPKRAIPREESQRNEANVSTKRLYVNGIREDHQEADFQEYFSKYGTVERVEIIKDKATGQYRGFAFISFNDFDPVDRCVLERRHMIKNHRCDVKKALSKEEISKAQQMERDRANRASRSRGTSRNSRGSMGNVHSNFGNPQSNYGNLQSNFGNPQSNFGNPHGGYGNPYSNFGNPPLSSYGSNGRGAVGNAGGYSGYFEPRNPNAALQNPYF